MSNLFSSGGAGNVGFSGETQQSLKFNDDESQYLSWTPASAGNRKTWTWSGWVKRGNIGVLQGLFASRSALNDAGYMYTAFNGSDTFQFSIYSTTLATTSQVFRDPSAWYHLVISFDATAAAAADRLKIYVNGLEAALSTDNRSSISNQNYAWNQADQHFISGRYVNSWSSGFDGYLSDINFIDGQALDASSFGETVDGYWKAKDYAGTYGTNGFHLTFQDDVVSEGFNTVTYTGTGVTNSVSGLGFSPDLVWIKGRNIAYNHRIYDTVRGVNKRLYSDLTNGEYTSTQSVMSFDADGFTLGTDAGENNGTTPGSFVAWCWDAGSGSAASNTDGSITSTVKANPDYGFSVITYTGTGSSMTFGHGLGVEPELHIIKRRDSADEWLVYAQSLGLSQALNLHNTNAAFSDSAYESISSTVIGIGTSGARNASGGTYVCYAFASVAGYSSIGSYSGTGSSGNAVTCGFRPAFIMIKKTDTTSDWWIFDTTRDTNNQIDSVLYANLANAEFTDTTGIFDFEITSNGFVNNSTNSTVNGSGASYIYMAFADTREAAFWKDVSGQGNHWTPNNLDYRDSLIDSPANNFAVGNPLSSQSNNTFSEGSLKVTGSGVNYYNYLSSMGMQTGGKYYFEVYSNRRDSSYWAVGLCKPESFSHTMSVYNTAGSMALQQGASVYYLNSTIGTTTNRYNSTAYLFSFAIDLDNNIFHFRADGGAWENSGDPVAGTGGYAIPADLQGQTLMPWFGPNGANYQILNFGQDSTFSGLRPAGGNTDANGIGDFAYAPPAGYLALCTANLPTPTIIDGSEHFNTVLWTGNGSHIDVGFDPDLLWYKARNTTSYGGIVDSIRGDDVYLQSYSTNADVTSSGLLVTDSTGFTPGSAFSSNDYVAWNWLAGGTAVSNTDGSITSQVSANVDAGFSVVSYASGSSGNKTVGHGLGATPTMIFTKSRDAVSSFNWAVYHKDTATTVNKYLILNNTTAISDNGISIWGAALSDTNANTFGIRSGNGVNANTNCIAYCFADVEGFSKAGSYTGNGSADGSFVFCGFRPAFVIVKASSTSGYSWNIIDTARDTYNTQGLYLFADTSGAEGSGSDVDILSNGFKLRNAGAGVNGSGITYIYLAFAETPFKYANAR